MTTCNVTGVAPGTEPTDSRCVGATLLLRSSDAVPVTQQASAPHCASVVLPPRNESGVKEAAGGSDQRLSGLIPPHRARQPIKGKTTEDD